MKKMFVYLAVACALAVPGLGIAAEQNTVKAAVAVAPVNDANVVMAEYERLLNDKLALGARFGSLDYEFKDGAERETGDGTGVEVLVRFYPSGGFKGLYVGGGIGFWNVDWEWTDPTDSPGRGSGSTDSTNVNIAVGWKLGSDKVYFEPAILIGNWLGVSQDDTGRESELGFYLALSLGVGIKF